MVGITLAMPLSRTLAVIKNVLIFIYILVVLVISAGARAELVNKHQVGSTVEFVDPLPMFNWSSWWLFFWITIWALLVLL